MVKTFLKLTLITHESVTLRGGAKVVRDLEQSRTADAQEAERAIMKRVRKAHKFPKEGDKSGVEKTRNNWREKIRNQLEQLSKEDVTVTGDIRCKGKPYCSYRIERKPVGIEFVERAKAKQADSAAPKARVHDGLASQEQREKAKAELAAKRDKLGMNPDGSPKDAPAKPPTKQAAKGKASAPASKPKLDGTLKKPDTGKADKQPPVTAPQLSKNQLKECAKFGVDPANPPASKPSGMKQNVWNKIKK